MRKYSHKSKQHFMVRNGVLVGFALKSVRDSLVRSTRATGGYAISEKDAIEKFGEIAVWEAEQELDY